MTTDSSADEQGVVSRAADVVEQVSDSRPLDVAARLGFTALAAVHVLIGVIALRLGKHVSSGATGLDGSLKALQHHPLGVYVLTAIAVGLICYGIFAIIRAVFGRM